MAVRTAIYSDTTLNKHRPLSVGDALDTQNFVSAAVAPTGVPAGFMWHNSASAQVSGVSAGAVAVWTGAAWLQQGFGGGTVSGSVSSGITLGVDFAIPLSTPYEGQIKEDAGSTTGTVRLNPGVYQFVVSYSGGAALAAAPAGFYTDLYVTANLKRTGTTQRQNYVHDHTALAASGSFSVFGSFSHVMLLAAAATVEITMQIASSLPGLVSSPSATCYLNYERLG